MNQQLPERDYQQWLRKVAEDAFAGNEILDGATFPAPACFHFQQAAEKSLKALLIFYGQRFPKVHDLVQLAALVERFTPDIRELADDLTRLNRYYVETRYPGDYPEFTIQECREAKIAALRIKDFVVERIESSGSS